MGTTKMKLLKFRVTNFRSVKDSGWVDAGEVTAMIGTNESGKTNLLLPLWKLNPAKEGAINLLQDAPRKEYNNYRDLKSKPVFIEAQFELPDTLIADIVLKTGAVKETVRVVHVSRTFAGNYIVDFPNASKEPKTLSGKALEGIFDAAVNDIKNGTPSGKGDEALQAMLIGKITEAKTLLAKMGEKIAADGIAKLQAALSPIADAPARSVTLPRYTQLAEALATQAKNIARPIPNSAEMAKFIVENLPVFVFYSTYGNLDSEIYLPHVIADLKRTDLTGRSEARARTLRVLFSFVKLKAEEILELGKDWHATQGKPTEAQIQELATKKKERSILLQSASTDLTAKFREWWKQGVYRIRFEADGDHFRIWVSDDQRTEEIELEGRSTGLQWFLSFYLVFLVESIGAHNGAILLLDEPGHSLHPLAQRDLSAFFESLANSNQLVYTTHSPFLVDADHLDRVRNVYVDEAGYTVASANLRAGQAVAQTKSVYAVHACLGLSVSDTLFQGCRVTVVEGQSDQIYMSAMKTRLLSTGRIKPARELLFVPATGTKAIKTISSILGGAADNLPHVLCDGDSAGRVLADSLKGEFYRDVADRVLLTTDFVDIPNAEVEDLMPRAMMTTILDRYLKGPGDYPFTLVEKMPLVPQVKAYAKTHGLKLNDGWKVELAKLVKARLEAQRPLEGLDVALNAWEGLFTRLTDSVPQKPTTETAVLQEVTK